MTRSIIEVLDQRWYPNHGANWDDEIFRNRILKRVSATSVVLDLGAGAGVVKQMDFRDNAGKVCGVDLDSRVICNPHLHHALVGSAENIPYPDSTFDVVFADNLFEHLDDPAAALAEVLRVLRPRGCLFVKTPNKCHYMPLISRLTPYAFHRFYNRLRGRADRDTFPTRYRANSERQLRRLAQACGFKVVRIEAFEGRPEYLRLSVLTYVLGYLYERIVNRFKSFEHVRIVLIAEFEK